MDFFQRIERFCKIFLGETSSCAMRPQTFPLGKVATSYTSLVIKGLMGLLVEFNVCPHMLGTLQARIASLLGNVDAKVGTSSL